ncbi:hypothetical protein [Microbispora sp. NPDC046933]|uniref:hypothetical protein n=1 Tax=Microbispora sp. NPDC046933 TaxID=3155618 RepID=UPI0033EBCB2F
MSKRKIAFTEDVVVVAPKSKSDKKLIDAPGSLAYDPEFAEYLAMKRAGAFQKSGKARGAA